MTESRRKYFTIHLMFASFGSNILADTNVVKSMHCVTTKNNGYKNNAKRAKECFVKNSTISILTVLSFFSIFSFPFNALYLFVYCLFLFSVFAFAPDSEVSGIEQYNKMCVYAKEVILKAAFALAWLAPRLWGLGSNITVTLSGQYEHLTTFFFLDSRVRYKKHTSLSISTMIRSPNVPDETKGEVATYQAFGCQQTRIV